MDFDFDAWARLAKDNPAEFERRREAVLRASIESAPSEHRQRLEGLQFQINMERQRSGSALGSCLKLNAMMWAGFHRLRNELNGIVSGVPHEEPARVTAEVIDMSRFMAARRAAATGEN